MWKVRKANSLVLQFTTCLCLDVPRGHTVQQVSLDRLPPRDTQKGKHLSEITQAWSVKAKIQNLTQSTGSFFCYSLLLSLQVYWWKLLLPLNSFFLGGCPFALDCPRQIRRKLHTCSFRRKSTLALRLRETTKSRHQPTQMIDLISLPAFAEGLRVHVGVCLQCFNEKLITLHLFSFLLAQSLKVNQWWEIRAFLGNEHSPAFVSPRIM